MRVISGSARGRRLAAPKGLDVRPTSDKVRGALFNILHVRPDGPELVGARVLDLFAGTGALGIEALSRGAALATFVERDRRAAEALRKNLESTGFQDQSKVLEQDAERLTAVGGPYDLVFVDPPYALVEASRAIAGLAKVLAPGGLALVEHAGDSEAPLPEGLVVADRRRYGSTAITFFAFSPENPIG